MLLVTGEIILNLFKITRREDRSELTSGVPAVLPNAAQGSYVGAELPHDNL